jgi:hypothetical protein
MLFMAVQSKILNYEIAHMGKQIGTAKVLIKVTVDGGKRTDTKLTLTESDPKREMHTTQVWAKSGRPTLKIVQLFDLKGNETSRTRIDFRLSDVVISQTVDGKLKKSTVSIPANAEIRDLPEFWFLRDRPVKGKPYQYLTFNATSLKWETAVSTYMGEKTFGTKAKTVNATSLKWETAVSTYMGEKTFGTKAKTVKRQNVVQKIGSRILDMLLDEGGFPVDSSTNDGTKIIAKF